MEAGAYTVVVRRTGAGEGAVRFTVAGVERSLALTADSDAATVPLRVSAEGGRTRLDADGDGPNREGPRFTSGTPVAAAQERVVVTEQQRERAAQRRGEEASATPLRRPAFAPTPTIGAGTPTSPPREREREGAAGATGPVPGQELRPPEQQRTPVPQRPGESPRPTEPRRETGPQRQRT